MPSLKQLYLYPVTGLYKECFDINYSALSSPPPLIPNGKYCLQNINNMWWHDALSDSTLEQIVERLQARYKYAQIEIPQHRAVLANPKVFIQAVKDAPRQLSNLNAGARGAFSALETLQVFCNLYSDMISYPHSLSLQEGLVLNELSSYVLVKEALSYSTNPYLPFIEKHVLPILREVKPNLVWISGRIRMSSFAMAMLARREFPNCHISVIGHSSEYFSLNKITKYLQKNDTLFSIIDSIVLDDPENTAPQLVECLQADHSIDTVPNLLYKSSTNPNGAILNSGIGTPESSKQTKLIGNGSIQIKDIISNTPLLVAHRTHEYNTRFYPPSVSEVERTLDHVDPSEIVNTKLWPNAKCYWDQCNFCAINKKYKTLARNSFKNAEEVADYMIKISKQDGIRFMWSIDEAIPPDVLGELAQLLIDKGANFYWETRSKVDKRFTKDVCEKLGKAGLREIRLGLESASPRVLSKMGKHPVGWSLNLIEEVVSYFHAAGVSVHFPTIIGFPTETESERLETFAFLEYIITKYPSVTFNMNILGFDVASKLFENYEDFGITTISWPTPAKYFLGNLLDWDCKEVPFEYDRLDYVRNELMRRLLYPWIPKSANIPEYIFYRLAETSRATMVWKAQRYSTGNWKDELPPYDPDAEMRVSARLVISGPLDRGQLSTEDRYFVYDWKTHHSFECNSDGLYLLEIMKNQTFTTHSLMKMIHAESKDELSIGEIFDRYDPHIQQLHALDILYCPTTGRFDDIPSNLELAVA